MPPHPPTRRRLLGTLAATAGTALLPARLTAQTTLDVTGPEALGPALDAATPGTVLRLAPGDYGQLNLRRTGGAAGAPVTLTAADPDRPPRFARMDLREVAHLMLEGLHFDYGFSSADEIWLQPFAIRDSANITVRACLFDGDGAGGLSEVDNGFGWGMGLGLRFVQGAEIEACEIRNFHRGLMVAQCSDVTVTDNNVHDMRSDGMNFVEVQRVLIEGNHIHDFNRSPASDDHPDMIQFWTNGTKTPSTNIVIRGNLLESGAGGWTQTIFMRNEEVDLGRAGRAMFYRDILIEENVISNAHLHGITVGEVLGLVIRRNTVLRNARSAGGTDDGMLWTPTIRVTWAARDVIVTRNIVADIAGYDGQPDWRVADNLPVQDETRMKPGFYDAVFTGSPADVVRLRYRRGGPADATGVGASRLQP